MIKIKKILGLVILSMLAFSCNKEEGEGGKGNIKGIVYQVIVNAQTLDTITIAPAPDEDVYLIYGDDKEIDDKTVSSYDGSFEYKYLRDGNYQLLVYSQDTSNYSKTKTPVIKKVHISNGGTAKPDTLFILKTVDYDKGAGIIEGIVNAEVIDNQNLNIIAIQAAPDQNVYILNSSTNQVLDKTTTSDDGKFAFQNLVDGNYCILVYSQDTANAKNKKVAIKQPVQVKNQNTVKLSSIHITKMLDIDEGSGSITGKIWLINYKSNGYTIKDIALAQEYDVYLIYGNHLGFDMRTRTSYDGTFCFSNLINGKYTVFVYSEQEDIDGYLTGATQKAIHKKTFEITNNNQSFYMTDTVKTF
ncbi:MAG TPA: hypothetical protein PK252_08500 [Bacteroidales bacterium]|nr:hypothetical protein [Bacteroidales bacterium]